MMHTTIHLPNNKRLALHQWLVRVRRLLNQSFPIRNVEQLPCQHELEEKAAQLRARTEEMQNISIKRERFWIRNSFNTCQATKRHKSRLTTSNWRRLLVGKIHLLEMLIIIRSPNNRSEIHLCNFRSIVGRSYYYEHF